MKRQIKVIKKKLTNNEKFGVKKYIRKDRQPIRQKYKCK